MLGAGAFEEVKCPLGRIFSSAGGSLLLPFPTWFFDNLHFYIIYDSKYEKGRCLPGSQTWVYLGVRLVLPLVLLPNFIFFHLF